MPAMPQPLSQGFGQPGMPNNPMTGAASGMPMTPGAGMPGMPGASGGMPAMPAMPPMGGFGPAVELKKGDKTKKIQGFDCTLYSVSSRMETFEIWATNDSSLFPFRFIERNYIGRQFGPQMLEEQWVELLRDKSLFPLEATLRREGSNREQLSFKIDRVERRKIDNDGLFAPPEKYIEIQAPQF
jgi:hypothetical protein